MGLGDFLRKDSETSLCEYFVAAGAVCKFSTNFEPVLAAARESFFPAHDSTPQPAFCLRVWVDAKGESKPPWPKPYFRGLDHLVFAGFDAQNSMMIDLRTRRAIGRFSPAMGADSVFWKTVIFPSLLSLLGPSVGVTGVHCACVVREKRGVLLWGRSGSGKSTLTLALARRGFDFLSDDWTYLSQFDGRLCAWGLLTRLKLLPEAAEFFPELANLATTVALNGERAFEIDPDLDVGLARQRICEPRRLIFLEREPAPGFHLTRMPEVEAQAHLEGDLLEADTETLRPQIEILQSLVNRGCWRLRFGGAPDVVAQKLAGFCWDA